MSIGPGSRLSHYQVLDEISRGGMGVVYRARDLSLNREVALKILPPELVSHAERRKRFIQEAQAASSLEHPHIAVIYEVGEAEGISFIAMELIRGEKLSEALVARPLGAPRALDLAVEIAEALALAHDKGVIHRDLKPANVMVTRQGHAKVIDFGLAKLVGSIAGEPAETTVGDTDAGAVLGTVSYMSPEQARAGRVDHRTDIFTFGILLHEMLSGQPPFRGPSGVETLNNILTAAPPPLPSLGGSVSAEAAGEIQRIRDKCLAKSPDERYQGMRDLVVDLRAARRRLESSSMAPVAAPAPVTRFWWAAAVAVIAIAVAVWGAARWRTPVAPVPGGKPSLAVLAFDNNTGNPALDWLRTGLADMLVTDLSQSPDVEIIGADRVQQILAEMNRGDDRTMPFDVVQQLAARAGAKTVLVGSYVKAGQAIRINTRLQDPANGRILSAERVDAAGEADLFSTMDELTRRLKARLVPRPTATPEGLLSRPGALPSVTVGIDRDLREVTTPSIEAYRYYAEGINLHERYRPAEAIPLFEKALEIDPNFALAMAKLSMIHSNINHPIESREYAQRAYQHVDRVTTRERYYIEGAYFSRSEGTFAQAIDAYEQGLKLYPDHASARNNLALIFMQLERDADALPHYEELRRRGMTFPGTYANLAIIYARKGEFEKGTQVLQEYLTSHPDVAQAQGALGQIYVAWGKYDDALAAFRRADALDPGIAIARNGSWSIHVLRGEWKEATAIAEAVLTSRDPARRVQGYGQLASMHLYKGRLTPALQALDAAIRVFPRPGPNTAQPRLRKANVLMAVGRNAAAATEALQARTEGQGSGVEWAALQAAALAQFAQNNQAEATALVTELQKRAAALPSEREVRRVHLVAAQMALQQKDSARALDESLNADKRLPAFAVAGGPGGALGLRSAISYTLGLTYLAAGRHADAEKAFRAVDDATVDRLNSPIEYARSLYFLATLAEQRGDMNGARGYYRRFLDYWADGEIDRDKVAEAERKLRGLATR